MDYGWQRERERESERESVCTYLLICPGNLCLIFRFGEILELDMWAGLYVCVYVCSILLIKRQLL